MGEWVNGWVVSRRLRVGGEGTVAKGAAMMKGPMRGRMGEGRGG